MSHHPGVYVVVIAVMGAVIGWLISARYNAKRKK